MYVLLVIQKQCCFPLFSYLLSAPDDSTPKPPSNSYSLASFQRYAPPLLLLHLIYAASSSTHLHVFALCSPQSSSMPCSAEHLAHRLVSGFRKQWFPSERLQNPDNLNIVLQEVRLVTRQHTFRRLAHAGAATKYSLFVSGWRGHDLFSVMCREIGVDIDM